MFGLERMKEGGFSRFGESEKYNFALVFGVKLVVVVPHKNIIKL